MQKESAIVGKHLSSGASKTSGGLVLQLFSLNQSDCRHGCWKWFLAIVACQFDGIRSQQQQFTCTASLKILWDS